VRNRYIKFCTCLVFATASALSSLAQSGEGTRGQQLLQPKVDGLSPALLAASLETTALVETGDESRLPDAPSASKPETPAAPPAASPVVRRESRGAAPAAMGGPLGVDGQVADRNYLLLTGGMISASVFDAEMTLRCLHDKTCKYLPNSLRSRTALYGIGIPADLGVSYLTYFMKKRHSRIWFVPAACIAGANLYVGMHALRELK
jgi:hypothetical protein